MGGVVYLGDSIFCTAGLFTAEKTQLMSVLSVTTAPFVVANLMQSLWCASFRPSYNQGWHKYISAFMLGGTAYSLSQVSNAVRIITSGTAAVSISRTLALLRSHDNPFRMDYRCYARKYQWVLSYDRHSI